MNNNNEYKRENEIKINELYKEKEFLENEYQNYKEKYIIYKSKYKEFKNNITFFMKFLNFSNINYHPIEDFEKILGNKRERENKQINNIIENNKIRKISIDSNNIGSDIFDKKYIIEQDENSLNFQSQYKFLILITFLLKVLLGFFLRVKLVEYQTQFYNQNLLFLLIYILL
jgi:hypothetical protein